MYRLFIISSVVSAIFLFGCKKEPGAVDEVLEVDAIVEQQAAFGWQTNQIIQTSSEIEEVTKTSDLLEGADIDTSLGTDNLKKRALKLRDQLQEYLPELQSLYKPLGDTIIIPINKPLLGKRGMLYYYSDSDILRFYEVKYKNFWSWQAVYYDSSEIVTIANSTMWDLSDDSLMTMHNTKLYNETAIVHMKSVVSNLEVTDYDGTALSGIILTQDINYYSGRLLSHLGKYVELNPDDSGTLREDYDYSDGTTSYWSVTFYADNTGEFSKLLRDGTTVNGTFDSVEDDMHGLWTEITDFPSGRYVDIIEREAEVTITLPDSIFEGSFSEIITFSSGNIDSSSVDILVKDSSDLKITYLEIEKKNNGHGSLRLEENESMIEVSGEWTTWDDYYIRISDTQLYFDGSGHIHYKVWLNKESYTNGDDPLIEVDYIYSAGGEGNGTLAYEAESYQFTTSENGTGEISKGGKSKTFNLIQ